MRIAVISDIHGNLYAFEAVLDALAGEKPDEIWCLGDVVGYGPRPNACCRLAAEHVQVGLAGNHDLGVLGTIDLDAFSYEAAYSAEWTRTVLTDESRAYLAGLPSHTRTERAELFHGSPQDPVWDYVLTADGALDALNATEAPLVLVGHSHIALGIGLEGSSLEGGLAPESTELDLSGGRWLLNPGSVGQPRDGDPRAAFLIVDFESQRARFRRVPYPVERTQAEIRERNLPETLADRLAHGV